MSDFAVELVAQERRSQSDSVCEDEDSERSTCPADDDSASASERSLWGDSEPDEPLAVAQPPPGEWQGHQDVGHRTKSTRTSHGGTVRVAKPISTVPDGGRTTIVLRKLPTIWRREDLVDAISSRGFHGRFDFAYLPIDFKKSQAFGFALVNFVTTTDAQHALAVFTGLMLAQRPVLAEWSEAIQGADALIAKYRNSAVMHDDVNERHRPLLLCQGHAIPFPRPTETIQAPGEQVQVSAKAEPAVPNHELRTTIIIRKLGRNSSVEQLMSRLNRAGFEAQYDFVYVPRQFTQGASIGFGVLNFVNHTLASEALSKIARGVLSVSGTTLTAEWSDKMHGLASLLDKYRGNKVMRKGMPKSFQPVVLANGVPIPYPHID